MQRLFLALILCGSVQANAAGETENCDRYLSGSLEWKLIRDRLPEIFKAEKSPYQVDQVTDSDELKTLLIRKLAEELKEFEANPSAEEMADLMEVLEALQNQFGISPESVAEIKEKKKAAKGGFDKGYVMKINPPDNL